MMKCVCVSCLYAGGNGLKIPTHLQAVTDWLMHRLCKGPHAGCICVCQSCVVGSCAISCAKIASSRSQNKTIKKYDDQSDDDPLVMQVNAVPHSEVLPVQGQSSQHGNSPHSNQIQDINAPRLNWKVNLEC